MTEWPLVSLGEITSQSRDAVTVDRGLTYPMLGVRWYSQGAFHRETVTPKAAKIYRARAGQFIYNRLFAWKGSFGLVTDDLADSYVSNEFPLFDCRLDRLMPEYLACVFGRPEVWTWIERVSTGTTASRNRWNEAAFNSYQLALPSIAEQRRIVTVISVVDEQIEALRSEAEALHQLIRLRRGELVDDSSIHEIRAEEAFAFSTGVRRTPQRANGASMTKYLRSANVGYGRLDLSDVQSMNYEPSERERFGLQYGDVLVSEGSASAKAVGTPAMWRDELPGPVCFQMTLLRLRAVNDVCTPEFAFEWCMWAYESGRFLDVAGGTSIKHISARRSSQMPVRLPPLARQRQITTELSAMTAGLEAVRNELDSLRVVRGDLLSLLVSQVVVVDAAVDRLVKAA